MGPVFFDRLGFFAILCYTMKSFFVFVVVSSFLLGTAEFAHADNIANLLHAGSTFVSANGLAKLTIGPTLTTFTVWLSGKELYQSQTPLPDMKVGEFFVSNNGKFVVWMLAEHFYDGLTKKNNNDSPALLFYAEGRPIKSYMYGELLQRETLVSHSTSHTQWVMSYRNPDWSPSDRRGARLSEDGQRFELQTTSFREYVFNVETGDMLSGRDSDLWTSADLIVYGPIKVESPGHVKISTFAVVKDDANVVAGVNEIHALDPTRTFQDRDYLTVVLKKKGDQWEIVQPRWTIEILYNTLGR